MEVERFAEKGGACEYLVAAIYCIIYILEFSLSRKRLHAMARKVGSGGGEVRGMDQIQHNHIMPRFSTSAAVIDILWFCRICAAVAFSILFPISYSLFPYVRLSLHLGLFCSSPPPLSYMKGSDGILSFSWSCVTTLIWLVLCYYSLFYLSLSLHSIYLS